MILTSLVIGEMQIQITLIYHYKPIRMVKFKNTMLSIGENMKNRNFIHCLWKCKVVQKWYNHFGKQIVVNF